MRGSRSGSGGDGLVIRGLELRCVVGAEDWEWLMPQRVLVDMELRGDFSLAGASDDLADAVDYRLVCVRAVEVGEGVKYRLLESLADRIARAVLGMHECIASVRVSVCKPLALAGFGDARVFVEVVRDSGFQSQDS